MDLWNGTRVHAVLRREVAAWFWRGFRASGVTEPWQQGGVGAVAAGWGCQTAATRGGRLWTGRRRRAVAEELGRAKNS